MDIFTIIMLVLLGLILVVLAILILVGACSFSLSMSRKSLTKHMASLNTERNLQAYKIDHSWWDKQEVEEVCIESHDGFKLFGHFISSSTNKLAILAHGYGGEYKDLSSYADFFIKRGYNVLAIECRGHGKSEGPFVGMGWLDRLDIIGWIDFCLQRNKDYQIVLFGQSMGATGVCMALGEKLPKNVICAISDCAFDNVYREFYHVTRQYMKFLTKPNLNIFCAYMKRVHDYDLKRADTVSQLKKSTLPVLFIHGKADTFVPIEMCYRLIQAVPEQRRDVFLVEDAGHIMSYAVDTKGYINAMTKFLTKYKM